MPEIVNIKEQIRTLMRLQEFDAEIFALTRQKEQLPFEIMNLEKAFEDKKATLQSLEEKAKTLALKRKEKEVDLASKEENIKKLTTQLAILKTNKEYQIMLAQIASLRTDNSVLEEEILKVMEAQDARKEEIAKEKALLVEEEKKFQEEKKKIETRIKEIEFAIHDLTAKRGHLLGAVEKRVLSTYERILKAREGIALVRVKDFSCQGCHMSVTPQVVNEIKMQEKLIICESCARILYLEEDM